MHPAFQDTLELVFSLPPTVHEILIAELDTLGCHGFLEEAGTLKAYIPAATWNADKAAHLTRWLQARHMSSSWREARIPAQDWNVPWEQSIRPITIPPFYVRPGWASPPDASLIDIVIDPKMSFGTGHHESTRLMLAALPEMLRPGDRVLDAGAGTAILSIAAARLGAGRVIAFDIDPWAVANAAENIERNDAGHVVTFREGALDVIDETGFDLILANINRQVLLEYLPGFAARLRTGGRLALAGLLISDRTVMVAAARALDLSLTGEAQEGDWWAGRFHAR